LGVVIQQHVEGAEESIAFAARGGALVGAVAMRKLATTAEGKTWAGEVRPLPIRETQQLAAYLARVDWHGGGEIEIVRRTSDSRRFLIDVNPRFPAWIHGSTQANGVNLPAALVDSSASGRTARSRFVRVVTEIPMRDELHLQIPSTGIGGQPGAAGKHPSAMPQLSRRLAAQTPAPRPESVDEGVAAVLEEVAQRATATPFEVFDYQGLATTLESVALRSSEIGLIPALSIKTNPDPQILSIARGAGWIAEAISGLEVEAATIAGWPAATVVLNGPAKAWPQTDTSLPYRAVFYDSVAELDAARERYANASHLGFRLRPLRAKSRFGVDCSSPPELKEVAVRMLDLAETSSAASHIHFASSTIGLRAWASEVEANLAMVCALERLSGQRVRLIDVGGGFSPIGLSEFLSRQAGELVDRVRACLPSVEEIVFEPGKAVLAPHGYVVSRVLFRSDDDLYIDSSLADLPDTVSLRRPVYVRRDKGWIQLPGGSGQVFGRSCIEEDIVARGLHVADLQSDDLLVFAYAGAYDTSMRYRFASAGLPIITA
jgi:diaminopimelate decarboxylase